MLHVLVYLCDVLEVITCSAPLVLTELPDRLGGVQEEQVADWLHCGHLHLRHWLGVVCQHGLWWGEGLLQSRTIESFLYFNPANVPLWLYSNKHREKTCNKSSSNNMSAHIQPPGHQTVYEVKYRTCFTLCIKRSGGVFSWVFVVSKSSSVSKDAKWSGELLFLLNNVNSFPSLSSDLQHHCRCACIITGQDELSWWIPETFGVKPFKGLFDFPKSHDMRRVSNPVHHIRRCLFPSAEKNETSCHQGAELFDQISSAFQAEADSGWSDMFLWDSRVCAFEMLTWDVLNLEQDQSMSI